MQWEWKKQTMKLNSINIRRELAGKNAEDGVKASDLGLTVDGGNDILDKINTDLRGTFYMVGLDDQGKLLPGALTVLRLPLLTQPDKGYAYDLQLHGYRVEVDHGIGDPIVLDGCRINTFRLACKDGGTVAVGFRVQFHPTPGQLDPLADKLQQEVTVTIIAPKPDAVQKKGKRQKDMLDGATQEPAEATS